MINPDKAKQIILDHVFPGVPVSVNLEASANLVLAEPLVSQDNIPSFDNSAMDGYAVRCIELQTATQEHPVILKNQGFVPAGTSELPSLKTGHCFRIATGSPMPPETDTVVMQESVEVEGDSIIFTRCPRKGENVRYQGEDIAQDAEVLSAGTLITPSQIALLSALGHSQVKVYPPVKVAVIATGSELVDTADPLATGKIRDTNSYMLTALAQAEQCICTRYGIVSDDPVLLRDKIQQALSYDVLLISGGVSVGDHDFVKRVLKESGVEEIFWKVGIQPGKPFFFGRSKSCLVFGMPGNPASSYVVFEEFVKPALRKKMGHLLLQPPVVSAILEEGISHRSGRRQFLRAALNWSKDTFYVRPVPFQGSHSLRSLIQANSLIIIPENSPELSAGEKVSVRPVLWFPG